MKRQTIGALVLALAVLADPVVAADTGNAAPDPGREAFGQPLPGLGEDEREIFFRGRSLFHQSWVIAPASDRAAGLGPLYNRISCISCHPKNGRGRAPDNSQQRMQSMLVRLSVPGESAHGGPKPHPVYGDQLNEQGVPGVAGEGIASITWQVSEARLADGTIVPMRRPLLSFSGLHYGALGRVQTSARVGPPVFGLGLLQSIAERDILNFSRQPKPNGVKGRINWVWDSQTRRRAIGRFGLKANMASLREQIAAAMLGDLGITSTLRPMENCMPRQTACRNAPSGGHPELSDARLADLEFYFMLLAAPSRRDGADGTVRRGEKIFHRSDCALCHRPTWHVRADSRLAHLSAPDIHPYTDLLIHDMGAGLADNRPDHLASGREWRTTPLWGLGLTEPINEYRSYLHDGRARTLTEAVLWHDGEAKIARRKFAALSSDDRAALEKFLLSL